MKWKSPSPSRELINMLDIKIKIADAIDTREENPIKLFYFKGKVKTVVLQFCPYLITNKQ